MQNDLVPVLALAFRMWRIRNASWPDYKAQPVPPPQPTMPDARTAPVVPAYEEFARVRPELASAALRRRPSRCCRPRTRGPRRPRARRDSVVPWRRCMAWVPLTPALFVAALLLLIAVRVWLWWREARHGEAIHGRVRVWRLVSVAGMLLWVGLAVVTAVSFSAM
jgi:hypothetical protein